MGGDAEMPPSPGSRKLITADDLVLRTEGCSEAQPDEGLPPAVMHVSKFLEQIRGFDLLNMDELEKTLWDNRFDLLGRHPVLEDDRERKRLPCREDIPPMEDLRNALLHGLLPNAHQCVAHILYPKDVAWPVVSQEPEAMVEEEPNWDNRSSPSPQPVPPESPLSRHHTPKNGSRAPLPCGSEADGNRAKAPSVPRRTSGGSSLERVGGSSMSVSVRAQPDPRVSDHACLLTLRGQPVMTTARGRDVTAQLGKEEPPDIIKTLMESKVSEDRYTQARERRRELERALRMEQYQEAKITERIRYLEEAQIIDVELRDKISKRDGQREKRREELKEQTAANWVRKIDEERVVADAEKQHKAMQAEAERAKARYYEKQKERVDQWRNQRKESQDGVPERAVASSSSQILAERKQKTMRQLETEVKMQRMREASEERPPVMPRPRDKPPPLLEIIDGLESARASSNTRRPNRGESLERAWAQEATTLSNRYGFSDMDARVAGVQTRDAKGAGCTAGSDTT